MSAPPPRGRRRTLLAGAAAALAAGAAGAWWWRGHSDPAEQALAEFLGRSFLDPAGKSLSLTAWRGRPLVLNFWATWCPPCVRELPELDQFARSAAPRGWQVLGVAIDQVPAVQQFLARTPVAFPVAVAGFGSLPVLAALGNGGGALPFSLVVAPEGRILHRKLGATNQAELAAWTA